MKNKVNDIINQLKDWGVEYKLSNSPHKPFKIIYKPIDKSDRWYKNFEEFIDLNHLQYAVETQQLRELRQLIREELWGD